MVKINFSQEKMRQELRTRKRPLDWMVSNDIRKSDQVAQIITEYYVRPNDVLARWMVCADGSTNGRLLRGVIMAKKQDTGPLFEGMVLTEWQSSPMPFLVDSIVRVHEMTRN